ncbi:hypothetical protein T01_1205 [Trichinella spiralis]|uniref:Uncharacterized protein n=1 Tax=Trichinella spiralis TaxID=6334 RepID=A0A0V1B0W3_TRISP|nr:hypothetical protein T01_1205 [Trichinella spiralis]
MCITSDNNNNTVCLLESISQSVSQLVAQYFSSERSWQSFVPSHILLVFHIGAVTCAVAPINATDAFRIFAQAGNFLLGAVGLTRAIVRRQLEAVGARAAETRPVGGRRQRCFFHRFCSPDGWDAAWWIFKSYGSRAVWATRVTFSPVNLLQRMIPRNVQSVQYKWSLVNARPKTCGMELVSLSTTRRKLPSKSVDLEKTVSSNNHHHHHHPNPNQSTKAPLIDLDFVIGYRFDRSIDADEREFFFFLKVEENVCFLLPPILLPVYLFSNE